MRYNRATYTATFVAAFAVCRLCSSVSVCCIGSFLSFLCRRDRAIRGFRLTWRPKHRGLRNIPLSCLNFATCSARAALAPRLSLHLPHLSPCLCLYGSLTTTTYPLRRRNNSSRATRIVFPLVLAFFLNQSFLYPESIF